jgi:hypothetical protein
MTLFLLREIVELPSGGGKRVFDRHLNMFVSAVVRRRVIDYNVLVRRNRKRNVDTESTAVTVFVTGAITATWHPMMWRLCFSNRSTSRSIATRTGSDGSDPSKVTCNGICMKILRCPPGIYRHGRGHVQPAVLATSSSEAIVQSGSLYNCKRD